MSTLRALRARLTHTIRGIVVPVILLAGCNGDYPVSARRVTEDPPPGIRINEIASAGSASTGWIELFNPTPSVVDLSGWTIIDDTFFGPTYTFAAGTTIAPGAFVVIDEGALPFGLDATYDLRLMSRFGTEVDRVMWIVPSTAARCPDGGVVGVATAPTRGSRNTCVN